jgi:hypothetical protein
MVDLKYGLFDSKLPAFCFTDGAAAVEGLIQGARIVSGPTRRTRGCPSVRLLP